MVELYIKLKLLCKQIRIIIYNFLNQGSSGVLRGLCEKQFIGNTIKEMKRHVRS
jgi:hypothetical protein